MNSKKQLLYLAAVIFILSLIVLPAKAQSLTGQPDSPTAQQGDAPAVEQPHITWLRDMVSESLKGEQNQLFGLEYWQWIALFLLILIGVTIDRIVRGFMRAVIARLTKTKPSEDEKDSIKKAVRPVGLLASAFFWLFVISSLDLPEGLAEKILTNTVQIFVVLASVWAGWRIVDLIGDILIKKAEQTETKFDDVLVPLVRKSFKLFIIIFGVIYGADVLDVEIAPLLAGLGIGGLAFGLAAKDTIENFFGSVAVLVDRPFAVGDWVVIGDVEGIVEVLGFRSTRIRTFYNSLVSVPNATLVRAQVDNYGQRKYRRWKTYIGVQYDTSPEKLVAFTEGIRELVRTHPYTRKDYFQVYLNNFGSSSLDILVYVFHKVPDWSTELRERERLFLDIVRLADRLNVNFAFPTQTIHVYTEDHNKLHTPAEVPAASADQAAKTLGIQTVQQLISNQPWQDKIPGPVTFNGGPTKLEETDTQIEDRGSGG